MKAALASHIDFTPEHYADEKGKKPTFKIKTPTRQDRIDFKYELQRKVGNVMEFQNYYAVIATVDEEAATDLKDLFIELGKFRDIEPPSDEATEKEIEEFRERTKTAIDLLNSTNEIEDELQQRHAKIREASARFHRDQELKRQLAFKYLVQSWSNLKVKYEADADGVKDDVLDQISDNDLAAVGAKAVELLSGSAVSQKN